MKKNLILFCLLVGLIVACQRPSNTQKTEEELKALSCIDDSVEALSPHAFRMIEKGMKSAQDSLAYYEYYIRKAKVSSNPQPIGFRGNLLVKRQKFFYCTYSLGITETS